MRSILLAAGPFLSALASHAGGVTVYTSHDLAPFASGSDAAPEGFHADIVAALAERSGLDLDLRFVPWERARKNVQEGEDAYLIAPTRNARSETLYFWVAPVLDVEQIFRTTGRAIDDFDTASGLAAIAARGSYGRTLEGLDFPNVLDVETDAALRMLRAGRIDAVFTLRQRAILVWRAHGFDAADLVAGKPVKHAELWIAGPPDGDAARGARLRDAMAALRADGTYDAIHDRYFGTIDTREAGPVAVP